MITVVAVMGAGQMGRGIAQVALQAKMKVILFDINDQALRMAKDSIEQGLAKIDKGQDCIDMLTCSQDIQSCAEASVVIEAITEKEPLKMGLLKQISQLVSKECLIASNTSSVSISRMSNHVNNPSRFIGIHFMNPVPKMPLVEVIVGQQTSSLTRKKALKFVQQLGKKPCVVKDSPGFIVNRLVLPMINEAIFILHEKRANVESIDAAMRLGANHPMGPLQLADFIGLDTCLAILQVLFRDFADEKYRPCPLLEEMVAKGFLGKKTRSGFYRYGDEKPIPYDADTKDEK